MSKQNARKLIAKSPLRMIPFEVPLTNWWKNYDSNKRFYRVLSLFLSSETRLHSITNLHQFQCAFLSIHVWFADAFLTDFNLMFQVVECIVESISYHVHKIANYKLRAAPAEEQKEPKTCSQIKN